MRVHRVTKLHQVYSPTFEVRQVQLCVGAKEVRGGLRPFLQARVKKEQE